MKIISNSSTSYLIGLW